MMIVGLGNPGSKYEATRHNVGMIVLDQLAEKHGVDWKNKVRWKAEVANIEIEKQKAVLIKPQTFMNKSGQAVQAARGWFKKIPVEHIVVAHDEADLPFGEVRLKRGGGSAGHNGIKSIEQHLGSPEFWRVRVGVGKPEHPSVPLDQWVLSEFSKDEKEQLEKVANEAIAKISETIQ